MAVLNLYKTIMVTFSTSEACWVLRQFSSVTFIVIFIKSFCILFTKEKPDMVSTAW